MTRSNRSHLPALLAAVLLAGACRSTRETDPAVAAALLERAEETLAAGDAQGALDLLVDVRRSSGLDPDRRVREERLFDRAAEQRFAELADAPAAELEELFDSELPDDLRARAGVTAAERLLSEDSRILAFRMIKKVDKALPSHRERVHAGDVVARAGLSLIRDPRRYKLLMHYSQRGVQALEYLVVRYPLDPHCPEAYFALSENYERGGDLDQAIERTEDLLVYHPRSPYAVAAAIRLPYLRLKRMDRDDYDRDELERARAEIEVWLDVYPGHELAEWAGELHDQACTRLTRSDLGLARYYRRVNQPFGVRLHAQRALDEALRLGLESEAATARELVGWAGPVEASGPAPDAP
jgi:tetratricopeptide (TPR) repeat protein